MVFSILQQSSRKTKPEYMLHDLISEDSVRNHNGSDLVIETIFLKKVFETNCNLKLEQSQLVRSAYQPPASSTFLSERTSHQQPAATSQQYSSLRTHQHQHQPSATILVWRNPFLPHISSHLFKHVPHTPQCTSHSKGPIVFGCSR
jgi:hypothetical protein